MGVRVERVAGIALAAFVWLAGVAGAQGDTRLVGAAAEQNRTLVRSLLKEGAAVNGSRADGVTALLWAAHWDDLEMVDLLLGAGANVNAADDHGVTPLARAAENASLPMVERLLRTNANPNAAQLSGLSPLMIAARTGSPTVVKALLAKGANVNAATVGTNSTALMWAVAEKHPDVVRVLLENQAGIRTSSSKGFTPLMYAARNGDVTIGKLLVAAGASVNDRSGDGTHVLPFAIIAGQADFAQFLLEQGADPNGTMEGIHALHAAAGPVGVWLDEWNRKQGTNTLFGGGSFEGNLMPAQRLALVKSLLARGANPNVRIGASAMFMSYIGYPKKGAFEPYSCGTGDLRGATPLWVAAYTANGGGGGMPAAEAFAEMLRVLMAGGADHKLTSDDGTTPLMVAAGLGRPTFDPNLRRGRRSNGAEEAVKVLLDAGADINAVNEADFTALHGAAFRGLNEVIQILVDRGADINARDFRGRTAFRMAEGSKQSFQFQAYPETAEVIKKLGADIRLGIPGTVQERLRDVPAAAQQQP